MAVGVRTPYQDQVCHSCLQDLSSSAPVSTTYLRCCSQTCADSSSSLRSSPTAILNSNMLKVWHLRMPEEMEQEEYAAALHKPVTTFSQQNPSVIVFQEDSPCNVILLSSFMMHPLSLSIIAMITSG